MEARTHSSSRYWSLWIGLAIASSSLMVGCGSRSVPQTAPLQNALTDVSASRGAAPGYIDDRACAQCHQELFDSYQAVGMAQSFFPPGPDTVIEDFKNNAYFHTPSQQHFEMVLRDGQYLFRRHQIAADGRPINVFEQPVDWILGSGHNARTYLYQTEAGELYQLPIAWYSEEGHWGMAPGFDRPDHEGVTRRVRRECMFCHNAYPDVPAGTDAFGASQTFPRELPHGIGCQRCHGPGAEHARANLAGTNDPTAGIVNPAKLSPELRDDVCHQCHLQPSVALFGIRRFGRDDYSFRPGQKLAEYIVPLDVVERDKSAAERFEINHHPYRLQQSRCFVESRGELNCLSCHDPHRKVSADRRVEHYRAACQKCHESDACHRADRTTGADASDCVSCHMPRRRTQDVVHVATTDHRIAKPTAGVDLLAPLAEAEPMLDDVILSKPDQGTPLGEIYRAVAVSRATNGRYVPAVDHLETMLKRTRPDAIEPNLDLAAAQLTLGRETETIATLTPLLERHPRHALALELLGKAQQRLGTLDAAERSLRQSLAEDPHRAASSLQLGLLELTRNHPEQAVTQLKQTVQSHPTLAAAWYHLGEAHAKQSHWDDAIRCYRRTLEIDPRLKSGYAGLEQALLKANRREEAERYRKHGQQPLANP